MTAVTAAPAKAGANTAITPAAIISVLRPIDHVAALWISFVNEDISSILSQNTARLTPVRHSARARWAYLVIRCNECRARERHENAPFGVDSTIVNDVITDRWLPGGAGLVNDP